MSPFAALVLGLLPIQQLEPSPRITHEVLAVAEARPSVVSVRTAYPAISALPSFRGGQLVPHEELRVTMGSGFVIDESGYVVTNYHVIEVATRLPTAKITVLFDPDIDDRKFEAQLVSWVRAEDLALLKIESPTLLPVATLGTSADLMLAERVIQIGNPQGRRHTVHVGVLSGLHRRLRLERPDMEDLTGLIQTDAAINPGCSGGPLLNIVGEVIGITTASRRDAENVGYAIPIDRVKQVLRDQLLSPSSARAWLGFEVSEVPAPSAAGNSGREKQVIVTHVTAGGPADSMGLEAGHRVTAVNGHAVSDLDAFNLLRLPLQPDEDFDLELACRGEDEALVLRGWPRNDGILFERMGLTVTARLMNRGLPFVQVTRVRPGSSAADLGLLAGDFLDAIQVDGSEEVWRMPSAGELARFVATLESGARLRIEVRRDDDGDRALESDEIYSGSLLLE